MQTYLLSSTRFSVSEFNAPFAKSGSSGSLSDEKKANSSAFGSGSGSPKGMPPIGSEMVKNIYHHLRW